MVTQAIIPLAGLGTRLLPLSSVIPKELLPINGKPNLEHQDNKILIKELQSSKDSPVVGSSKINNVLPVALFER